VIFGGSEGFLPGSVCVCSTGLVDGSEGFFLGSVGVRCTEFVDGSEGFLSGYVSVCCKGLLAVLKVSSRAL
jgi:hypothetical protein